MTSGAQLSESECQSALEYQHHHYLHYLHVIWMPFKAVLGNIAILLLDLQTNKCIALPIFSKFTSFTR
jgi:hypothetical protein